MVRGGETGRRLALLYLLQGANHLLGFLTVPYLARALGPTGYGQVAFALGLVGYLSLLVSYGFDLLGARRAAQSPRESLGRLLAEVLGGRLLLLGLALTATFALLPQPAIAGVAHLLLPMLGAVVAQALSPTWLLLGRGYAPWAMLLELGQRGLTLLGLLLWVRGPEDGTAYAFLVGGTALLASGIGLILSFRLLQLQPLLPQLASSLEALRGGWWLFLSQGASNFLTGGNAFLLGLFASPQVVAQYAAAEKLALTLAAFLHPLFRLFFPMLSALAGERQAFLRLGRKALGISLLVGGGLAMGLAVSAPVLVLLIFGTGYGEAVGVAVVLAPWLLLNALNLVWGYLVLVAQGRERAQTLLLLAAGATHVALAWVLAPRYGATGMALALVGSGACLACGQALFLRLRAKIPPLLREEP